MLAAGIFWVGKKKRSYLLKQNEIKKTEFVLHKISG